jgi:hypothetical protein
MLKPNHDSRGQTAKDKYMAWICPNCKVRHNETAGFTTVNGETIEGFCSDSCLNAYKTEHPDTTEPAVNTEVKEKSKGKEIMGELASKAGGEIMNKLSTKASGEAKKAALKGLNAIMGKLFK